MPGRQNLTVRGRRRGTILVFVLGVLTLLALIGVGLMASVRGERNRVDMSRQATPRPHSVDSIVETIRERLRADIWGPAPLPPPPPPLPARVWGEYLGDDLANTNGILENNEPYDAPGPDDRWLASTIPHLVTSPSAPFVPMNIRVGMTGVTEQSLAWPRVSYLGVDVLSNTATAAALMSDYRWFVNSRTALPFAVGQPVYGEDVYGPGRGSFNSYLRDLDSAGFVKGVPIIMTPPDYTLNLSAAGAPPFAAGGHLIPGATTDITIDEARRLWMAGYNRPDFFLPVPIGGAGPKFPYFDTNMDGVLDLYDADGDGVPDSPLSFEVTYPGRDPADPRRLYAAIRIIDNCSMINVNTAYPNDIDSDRFPDVYVGTAQDLQRRGRRPGEIVIDYLSLDADERKFLTNRGQNWSSMISNPPNSLLVGMGNYERIIGRRLLLGGPIGSSWTQGLLGFYRPYDVGVESALRRRFILAPNHLSVSLPPSIATGSFSHLETALPNSLIWTQSWNGSTGLYSYTASAGTPFPLRADRFDLHPQNLGGLDERGDFSSDITSVGGKKGLTSLLSYEPTAPWYIRRPLFTTISYASTRQPRWESGPPAGFTGRQVPGIVGDGIQALAQAFHVDMWDPLTASFKRLDLNEALITTREEKVDLNPVWLNLVSGQARNPTVEERTEFLTRLIGAIYFSLNKPGMTSSTVADGAPWPPDASLPVGLRQRERYAYQLALNILDYIDQDDDNRRTILVQGGPGGIVRYVGQERQAFFSKAGLIERYPPNANGNPSETFYAVELINPYNTVVGQKPNGQPGGYRLKVVDQFGALKFRMQEDVGFSVPATSAPNPTTNLQFGRAVLGSGNPQTSDDFTPPSAPGWIGRQVMPDPTYVPPAPYTNQFELRDGDRIYLYQLIRGNTFADVDNGVQGAYEWPIDSIQVRRNNPSSTWNDRDYYVHLLRNEHRWEFTVDAQWRTPIESNTPTNSTVKLNFSGNTGDLHDQVAPAGGSLRLEPSPWVIRNAGFIAGTPPAAVRNFESPGDLSRLLALGVVPSSSQLGTGTNAFDFKTVQQQLRGAMDKLPSYTGEWRAAGRLNWQERTSPEYGVRSIFEHLTCLGLSLDGINNDGDDYNTNGFDDFGDADSPNEAANVHYRVAGLLNLNTAPAHVLRTLPYFASDDTNAASEQNDWDLAAAAVAYREKRHVVSPVIDHTATAAAGGTTIYRVAPAGTATKPAFRSVGDLMELVPTGAAPRPFAMDRFVQDNVNLEDPSLDLFSPDFDAATQDSLKVRDDIRERDVLLARVANLVTTRSDVFTVYIALIDEHGRYVKRTRFTLDRSVCATEDHVPPGGQRRIVLPAVVNREDTDYYDDTR